MPMSVESQPLSWKSLFRSPLDSVTDFLKPNITNDEGVCLYYSIKLELLNLKSGKSQHSDTHCQVMIPYEQQSSIFHALKSIELVKSFNKCFCMFPLWCCPEQSLNSFHIFFVSNGCTWNNMMKHMNKNLKDFWFKLHIQIQLFCHLLFRRFNAKTTTRALQDDEFWSAVSFDESLELDRERKRPPETFGILEFKVRLKIICPAILCWFI